MTILLGLLFVPYFISERSQQFQTKVLLLQEQMLISVKTKKKKKYLDLDQVERDFCSARKAYTLAWQVEVTEERDLHPNSQEVS